MGHRYRSTSATRNARRVNTAASGRRTASLTVCLTRSTARIRGGLEGSRWTSSFRSLEPTLGLEPRTCCLRTLRSLRTPIVQRSATSSRTVVDRDRAYVVAYATSHTTRSSLSSPNRAAAEGYTQPPLATRSSSDAGAMGHPSVSRRPSVLPPTLLGVIERLPLPRPAHPPRIAISVEGQELVPYWRTRRTSYEKWSPRM